MTQKIEFVDKDIKTLNIMVFYILKKLEERLNIINRDMKDSNGTQRLELHYLK